MSDRLRKRLTEARLQERKTKPHRENSPLERKTFDTVIVVTSTDMSLWKWIRIEGL